MLYELYWQEVFPWPTPEDETPECTWPVSGDYIAEVLDLQPGQVLPYCFECQAGDSLSFSVASTVSLEIIFCKSALFERWAQSGLEELKMEATIPRQTGLQTLLTPATSAKGTYYVVVVNPHLRTAHMMVAAKVCPP